MASSLFAKKSLADLKEQAEETESSLKRSLSALNLVALGIGAIIGAGLFSLTGLAAANYAGPAVTLSFLLAAVGCAFAGLCYSEFATMIPVAGSAYTYAYATMGEFIAWIIGWDLVLEYAVGAATVSISWSAYVVSFLHDFNINLPPELVASPWQPVRLPSGELVHGIVNLPAAFIVAVISWLLITGIQESARVNAVVVVIKVAVVVAFIGAGIAYINPVHYEPFIPENTGEFGHFGFSGILRAAGIIFFAYIGFDAVSTAAQEAKNPQKDMPIGIIGSLIICTILYVGFATVMTGLVPYTELNNAAPVATAVDRTPFRWLNSAIKLAIICGYTSVILVMLLGQSRVFFSMSRDGLLPGVFSRIHPTHRTPWLTNVIFAIGVGIFAALAPIQLVGEMTSIGTLLAFVIVCAGILVMRRSNPDVPRPFRTPWVPFVPIMGIISCGALMLGLGLGNWLRLVGWLVLGVVVYFFYSRHHSKVRASAARH
ncbi:MAG: amino acid permease [Bryobacterales bacterium]|nr:amino acid permease [Bryobacterales bacterium]